MTKITCGKFDNVIDFNHIVNGSKKLVRIGSLNPNKLIQKKYTIISTNGNKILYNYEIYTKRDFFLILKRKKLKDLLVLTFRERELILDESVDFKVKVKVFEKLYPIFDHIKYNSNLFDNYEELLKLTTKMNSYFSKGNSLADLIYNQYLYKVERKLRFKNTLDSCFFFAYKGGYQEIFKLKEERNDRTIIALDFNSMYPSCMTDEFLDPKNLKYKKFKFNKNIKISLLKDGLYHVILKKPKDTFFRFFHPFKYTKYFNSFDFILEEKHEVRVLLFKNELEYYSGFFDSLEIIEYIYSDKTIDHPLKNEVSKLYKSRKKYKSCSNMLMANLTKFKLVLLHSVTNSKKYINKVFFDKNILREYLSREYMINSNNENIDELIYIKNQENFKFVKNKNKYIAKLINFRANENIYCISSQITANSRLKMLKTIEKLLSFDTLEICYCNIDSIHVSISKKKYEDFINCYQDLLSDDMGKLKIESIADKGYWFDIGRYWLIKDNKVVKFKNLMFNRKGNRTEFLKTTKLKYIVKNQFYDFTRIGYKNIYSSFSYKKRLIRTSVDNNDFTRYNYEEIKSLNVAYNSINIETLRSKKFKVELFNKIATV